MKISLRLILLSLLILIGFTFYISKGNIVNYLLKPYLETALSERLKSDVSIKKIDLSLLKASLNVTDIHIKDRKQGQGIEGHIPELKASIQVNQLFLGRLMLDKGDIVKPTLTIHIRPKEKRKRKFRLRIPWIPLLRYDFNEINIHDANIALHSKDLTLLHPKISLRLRPKKNNHYYLTVNSEADVVRYRDFKLKLEDSHIEGDLAPKGEISGQLSCKTLTFQNQKIHNLSTQISYAKRSLLLKDMEFTPVTGKILANASFSFTPLLTIASAHLWLNGVSFNLTSEQDKTDTYFNIQSPNFDLSKLITQKINVKGKGVLKGSFFTKKGKPHLRTSLTMKDTRFSNIYLGDTKGNVDVNFGDVTTLTSKLEFSHPLHSSRGNMNASFQIKKKILTGSGMLRASKFYIFNEYFSSLELPFTVKKNNIYFPNTFLKKKSGALRLSGSLKDGENINLSITSHKLALGEFDTLPSHIDGSVVIRGRLKGTLQNPAGNISIHSQNVRTSRRSLGSAAINIVLKKKVANIHSQLFNGQVTQSATLGLTSDLPYSFKLKMSRFDFAPFLPAYQNKVIDLRSSVTGTSSFSGSLKGNHLKNGTFTFRNIRLSGPSFEFHNEGTVSLSLKNNDLIIKPFLIRGTDTAIKIQGKKKASGQLSFLFEGPLNLELVPIFLPSIEKSTGKSRISCRVGGTVNSPTLFGNFSLSKGTLKTKWIPHSLEKLTANISFSKNKIGLSKFEGILGGGLFKAIGDITLVKDRSPSYDIQITLKDNELRMPKWLSTRVSGKLFLQGIQRPYLLSGKLRVLEAHYKENVDWQSQIINIRRKRYLPKIRDRKSPPLRLDIQIVAPRNVYVKNDVANLESRAEIILRGLIDRLVLLGKIDLISGKAFFKGNRFTLNSVNVTFDNPIEIDPRFTVNAETTIKEYKLNLNIEGKLSDYKVNLSSQPALPESDIISLLTLGGTRADIEKGGGLDIPSLELGSIFFGDIQKAVQTVARKTLGVSFSLTPSYSDTKHTTVPRLIIGKQLTKKIDATFSSTLDRSSIFAEKEFNLKFNINRNLSLTGFWEDHSDEVLQDDASVGVDLKVQFEFR